MGMKRDMSERRRRKDREKEWSERKKVRKGRKTNGRREIEHTQTLVILRSADACRIPLSRERFGSGSN